MLVVLKLLGSIALLIYGMKVMSEALQKMAGPQLRHLLGAMTTNRFSGVATGALVTVAVQSSAATTVMTVSFVNAALLTLSQAISVIMGANIGTTLSAWIMSAGFSFNIANLVWPAFLIGIILIQIGKHRYVGDFLFGISFLLFAQLLDHTAVPAYRRHTDMYSSVIGCSDGYYNGSLLYRRHYNIPGYRTGYG